VAKYVLGRDRIIVPAGVAPRPRVRHVRPGVPPMPRWLVGVLMLSWVGIGWLAIVGAGTLLGVGL
jgi:hypothetical protein